MLQSWGKRQNMVVGNRQLKRLKWSSELLQRATRADEAGEAAEDEDASAKTQVRTRGPGKKFNMRDVNGATRPRVKAEPHSVCIKKERVDKNIVQRKGFARGILHYRYQVACINSLVPPPWKLCFGAFGSGIIGVRPEVSRSKAAKIKKEMGEPRKAEEDAPPSLPADSTVILLLNAPSFPQMARNGNTLGGYAEELNVAQATMRWSSQRRDRHNRMVNAITAHCNVGGRVVVVARSNADKRFKLLGDVALIDDVRKSGFLVQKGDGLLSERGNNLYHKTITVSCLNTGLKSGVGLCAVRYPVPPKGELKAKFCPNCCFRPPSALLHFKELQQEGVAAYGYMPPVKGEKVEDRAKAEASTKLEPGWREEPLRRLWAKQPASEMSNFCSIAIKQEMLEGQERRRTSLSLVPIKGEL